MKNIAMLKVIGALALMGHGATVSADMVEYGSGATGQLGFPFNGSDFSVIPGQDSRFQQVYDASFFSGGPIIIDAVTFFPNPTATSAVNFHEANYQVYLSTTSKSVNGLEINLDNNVGADEALFMGTTLLSGVVPSPFTIDGIDFSYDPSAGNLLLEVRRLNDASNVGGGAGAMVGTTVYGTDSSQAHNFAFAPNDTVANASTGLRTTFSVFDDPSAPPPGPLPDGRGVASLLALGLMGVALRSGRSVMV